MDLRGWLVDVLLFRDDGTFEVPNANSHGSGQGSWYMDPSKTDIALTTTLPNFSSVGVHGRAAAFSGIDSSIGGRAAVRSREPEKRGLRKASSTSAATCPCARARRP